MRPTSNDGKKTGLVEVRIPSSLANVSAAAVAYAAITAYGVRLTKTCVDGADFGRMTADGNGYDRQVGGKLD